MAANNIITTTEDINSLRQMSLKTMEDFGKVNGFELKAFAYKRKDLDYLGKAVEFDAIPAKILIKAFRLKHPKGLLRPETIEVKEDYCRVTVGCYLDRNDANPVSIASTTVTMSELPVMLRSKGKMESTALTYCMAKAVQLAGIGMQFDIKDERDESVEKQPERKIHKGMMYVEAQEQDAKAPDAKAPEKKSHKKVEKPVAKKVEPEAIANVESKVFNSEEDSQLTLDVTKEQVVTSKEAAKEIAPSEVELSEKDIMSEVERIGSTVIVLANNRYDGKTIAELADQPEVLKGLLRTRRLPSDAREAIEFYLEAIKEGHVS